MDFSKLSYQQILNSASVLNTCAINLDMILNVELVELINKIGDENFWQGESANKINEEFNLLKEKFPHFADDLKKCSSKLEKLVNDYQNADKEANHL